MKKRIAFAKLPGHSRYPYNGEIPLSDGMPRASGTKLGNALECWEYTDNKGNMLIGEAPSRFIESDRKSSCFINLWALHYDAGWSAERISDEIQKNFDLVVLPEANAIRPGVDHDVMADILDALKTEFIVLGLGMQKIIPADLDQLHPNLKRFLQVIDKKASLIGVRGHSTENWLKSVGLTKAKALGCPSLYVYPENILKLRSIDATSAKRFLTGGYIQGKESRSSNLIKMFRGHDAHYIMQDELNALKRHIHPDANIYNDANGEVNKSTLNELLEAIHSTTMPFSSYRWFQDPNAWRAFNSGFDLFLGDRFHGGVAALQAGVPAIMIKNDLRVDELTSFFGIPSITGADVKHTEIRDMICELVSTAQLEQFKGVYRQRLADLSSSFKEIDTELTIQTPPPLSAPPTTLISKYKKVTPSQKIKKTIKQWLSRHNS